MATLDQVIRQIRFELDQLSARNAHHEFEHLCRHLTRACICSNVLPATGPVAAGGDQGRDFETFRTYLHVNLGESGGFVGLISTKPIAFTCTLTHDKDSGTLSSKIKRDVKTITASGSPISDIHCFCSESLPIAKRHTLMDWARRSLNIHLEIYDGEAIAELLSGRDTFWIAERFLSVPSEVYPSAPPANDAQWYVDLKERWRDRCVTTSNWADFSELRDALRYAIATDAVRNDISFWTESLFSLRSQTRRLALWRRCTYEIVRGRFRGQKTMQGLEGDVRAYFEASISSMPHNEYDDLVGLLCYVAAAARGNVIEIARDQIVQWRDLIIERIEHNVASESHPVIICQMLRARLMLHTNPLCNDNDTIEIDAAVHCWYQMLKLVDQTPYFPIERESDHIMTLIGLGYDHPEFENILDAIDNCLVQRRGGQAIAEKCVQRAEVWYKRGNILKALNEIHRAKLHWFTEDTIRESLHTCLFLSNLYSDLGLHFAAKYYAMVAAFVGYRSTDETLREFVARGFIAAACCDYVLGAWSSFLVMSLNTIAALSEYFRDDDEEYKDVFERLLYHIASVQRITRLLAPLAVTHVEHMIAEMGVGDHVAAVSAGYDTASPEQDIAGVLQLVWDNGIAPPWSDLDAERMAGFNTFGIDWTFRWRNTLSGGPFAEEFLAVFQIVAAQLATNDLRMLPTKVDITLLHQVEMEEWIAYVPSNDGIYARAKLPQRRDYWASNDRQNDDEILILVFAFKVLCLPSVMNEDELTQLFETALDNGVFTKTLFGSRYVSSYYEFMGNVKSNVWPDETVCRIPFGSWSLPANLPFVSQGMFAKHCSDEQLVEQAINFCRTLETNFKYTLARLRESEAFRNVVESQRKNGWLDWQILQAVAHVSLIYRIRMRGSLMLSPLSAADIATMVEQHLMNAEESVSLAVPLSEFTEEAIVSHLASGLLIALQRFGHQLHVPQPDYNAIFRFLSTRYIQFSGVVPYRFSDTDSETTTAERIADSPGRASTAIGVPTDKHTATSS